MASLSPSFRGGLIEALSSVGQTPWQGPEYRLQRDRQTTPADVIAHMHTCWDNVLRFLVEEHKDSVSLAPEIRALVESPEVNLLRRQPDGKLELTQKGYEFMLKGVYMQVWEFIQVYLQSLTASETRREQVLDFLYHLSYCRVGDAYHKKALTDAQRELLPRFRHLGLIYIRKDNSKRFYPTPLGVHLMAGGDGNIGTTDSEGYVADDRNLKDMRLIVQTNLKVIAYTTSPLHASMLGMFSEVRMRLPNMILCELTRKSVKRAVKIGVNGNRIKDFILSHAHPILANRSDIIPENVNDQIDLWESESSRVKFDAAVLIDLSTERLSESEIDVLISDVKRKEAQDKDQIILWSSREKQKLVVKPEKEEVVLSLLEQHRDSVVVLT